MLVEAVRKHKRVFQVGSQQRTMEMNRFACELVRSGGIGKLKCVQGVSYTGPRDYDGLPEQPIPEGDDWDLWRVRTEAAAVQPRPAVRLDGWRAYSGRRDDQLGGPRRRPDPMGAGDEPDRPGRDLAGHARAPTARSRCGTPTACWSATSWTRGPMGGGIFIGQRLQDRDQPQQVHHQPARLRQGPARAGRGRKTWEGPGWIARPHIQNWLDCIKTREKPNADVEIGHRSISVCHLANIARELGRKLRWDPDQERFEDDDEANALLDRPRRRWL